MKYDHELEIDGEVIRLTLARSGGSPLYSVTESPPTVFSQGQEDPYKALTFVQTDWIGGYGQGDFIWPDMYYDGQSIDTTQDGKIIPGPKINEVQESDDTVLDSSPLGFRWFQKAGELLCYTTSKIYRYDVGSNGKWTAATTAVSGVTDLKEFATEMYAARGTSTYKTSANGDTWTDTDLSDDKAEKFLVAPNTAGTTEILWKFVQPNEVKNSTNGKASGSQWSSATYVGDTNHNITNLMLLNDTFLVGRLDNLYYLDSAGGVHPLYDDLRTNISTSNFKYWTKWKGALYYSLLTGMGELLASGSLLTVGPHKFLKELSKKGSVVGLASDTNWMYVAIDEGTNTIIYKVREWTDNNGVLRWSHCPFVFLGTNACAAIYVCQHSPTDRRLWFAYGTKTGYVKIFDDPTGDSNAESAPSGNIKLSWYYGPHRHWKKLFQYIVTQTENCDTSNYWQPKFLIDSETTTTQLTDDITNNGTRKNYLVSEMNCDRVQFRLDFVADGSTFPSLSHFEARGLIKPELFRVHDATYVIGDEPTRKSKTFRDLLRKARATGNLIKFADLRWEESTKTREYHWVIVLPGSPAEVEISHGKNKHPELGLRVQMIEVDYKVR